MIYVGPSGASRDLIRVLVADSNQTQSQLLSSALRRQTVLRVACCRSEVSDCLQALRSSPFDILLLGDGPTDHDHLIETLRTVHANHPRVGLILLLDTMTAISSLMRCAQEFAGYFAALASPSGLFVGASL